MGWISSLNEYSGLFALLALIAAVVVPFIIYKIQKIDERRSAKDELEAMNNNSRFPMSMDEREYYTKQDVLKRKAGK